MGARGCGTPSADHRESAGGRKSRRHKDETLGSEGNARVLEESRLPNRRRAVEDGVWGRTGDLSQRPCSYGIDRSRTSIEIDKRSRTSVEIDASLSTS